MSDAAAWDARYGDGGFAFGEAPNRGLEALLPRLRPGMRALALGDGEGRNGVWLAERGLAVTSVDWSAAGMAKAAALAARRGVALRTVTADLTQWDAPVGAFDLIAWVYVHLPPDDRAVVAAKAVRALARGGLLFLEGFTPAQEGRRSGGPRDPALLWTGSLARQHFAGLELLECLEGTVLLDEGPKHQGHAEVVRALFRAP
ncbi:methyltransferase domain-containing protein [Muricoccus radiodurans]|uniref:methyltransferase domain-containing protein n=1 Tax=Muricoccus radiodurans TaxID=2231721 RepID=UPI003CE893F0